MASAVVVNGAQLAGDLKELPAAPSALEKPVVVNGAPVAGHLKELPAAPSALEKPVASAIRLLNTKGGSDDDDDTSGKRIGKDTVDSRLALDLSVPKRFPTGAIDFFSEPPSKLLELLALTEHDGAASGTDLSGNGWWVSKEDDDALQLKVPMPGLGKEHVKVSAEKSNLVIKGEGDKDPEDRKSPARYTHRIQLPAGDFKMDQIKAEMNNGVLKVTPRSRPRSARTCSRSRSSRGGDRIGPSRSEVS